MTMRQRAWRRFCWRCLIYGLIFIGSVVTPPLVMQHLDRDPIVAIESMEVAGDVAVARGRINIRSHFDKVGYCNTEVGRFLWREEPHNGVPERIIVPLTATNTALTGIGADQRVVVSLDVPPHLAMGRWFYYAIAEDRCGFFARLQVRRTPDIPLEFIPDPAQGQ